MKYILKHYLCKCSQNEDHEHTKINYISILRERNPVDLKVKDRASFDFSREEFNPEKIRNMN